MSTYYLILQSMFCIDMHQKPGFDDKVGSLSFTGS